MAEEEILQEAAPPAKKKDGGGFSFVHLIIIAVIMIVVTALSVLMIQSKFGSGTQEVLTEIGKINTGTYGESFVQGERTPLRDCAVIADLAPQKDPLIVNLADGESYLSVSIAVCIDEDYTVETFEAKKAMVLYAANQYLSTLSRDDIFPVAGNAAAAQGEEEVGFGELFDEESSSFSLQMDKIRGELLTVISGYNIRFIKDLYFTSFLVQ